MLANSFAAIRPWEVISTVCQVGVSLVQCVKL